MEDGRRIKPFKKWLAEKEKNEQEGNFELPSILNEEEEEEEQVENDCIIS